MELFNFVNNFFNDNMMLVLSIICFLVAYKIAKNIFFFILLAVGALCLYQSNFLQLYILKSLLNF